MTCSNPSPQALFRHFLHTPLVAWEASTYVDKELLRLQFT